MKVATNYRDWPAEENAVVPAAAPLTLSKPPETVAEPPPPQVELVQSAGRAVPKNSHPAAGLRITSPLAVCATAVPASVCPALKSAAMVSVIIRYGLVVNDHVTSGGPSVALLTAATVPETVT